MGQDYILYFIHALLSSHQTSRPVRLSTLPHSIAESFKSGLARILSRSIGSDHNVTSFSPKSHDYYNRFLGIISNYGDICWSLVISQILKRYPHFVLSPLNLLQPTKRGVQSHDKMYYILLCTYESIVFILNSFAHHSLTGSELTPTLTVSGSGFLIKSLHPPSLLVPCVP